MKPESQPALDEIGRLLTSETALRLYVVGHTDNVGSHESNLALSRARAEAVVAALVARASASPISPIWPSSSTWPSKPVGWSRFAI